MALLFDSTSFPNSVDGDFSILRLTFNQDIKVESPWDLDKFRVIPLTGGVEPKVLAVALAEGETDALDLTISTMTGESGSNSYKAWIESGYLSNLAETETLDSPNHEELLTGQASAFAVTALVGLTLTSVRATFNRRVLVNSDLLDPTRYTFTNGLQCLGVMLSGAQAVDLVTTAQDPGESYELSVVVA